MPDSIARPAARATPSAAPGAYDVLLGEVDTVIGEWRVLVRDQAWAQLPETRLIDSLPEMLPKIFRLARAGATEATPELGELIADAHGAVRRADRMPLAAVAEEWAYVRRACANVLARRAVPPATAAAAMERIDVLLDEAVGYSLRGYYAPELDELRGRGLDRRTSTEERRSGEETRRAPS